MKLFLTSALLLVMSQGAFADDKEYTTCYKEGLSQDGTLDCKCFGEICQWFPKNDSSETTGPSGTLIE